MADRLQKLLSQAGIASRREAETLIVAGRVTVNGQVVTELGTKADPLTDQITVDGKPVRPVDAKIYLLLYKPVGYLTTLKDPEGRPIVTDLLKDVTSRVYPVGRLDYNTEGLLLLTNDGELTNALTHPKFEHEKEYVVLVEGRPNEGTLKSWKRGVLLEGEKTAPAKVEIMSAEREQTWLRVIMHEGRKRQIREVAGMLGHKVKYLQRVRLGPLELGELKLGRWRRLTSAEVRSLMALVKSKPVKRSTKPPVKPKPAKQLAKPRKKE